MLQRFRVISFIWGIYSMAYSAQPCQVNWQLISKASRENLSCKALFWNTLILQALVGKTFQQNPPTPQPGRARRRAKPEHGTIRFVIMCPGPTRSLSFTCFFSNGWQYILVWNCCCRWPELLPQVDGLPRTVAGYAEQTNWSQWWFSSFATIVTIGRRESPQQVGWTPSSWWQAQCGQRRWGGRRSGSLC